MKIRLILTAIVAMLVWIECGGTKENGDIDHCDHNDRVHSDQSFAGDLHSGHGHYENEESNGHADGEDGDDGEISVAPDDIMMAGITTAKVKPGRIGISLDLAGEIGFNEDRLIHISPRFPGVIKEIRYKIGDYVQAGEVVAVIESNESMVTYSLKAPISGRIVEKYAAAGEHVSEEECLVLLADLSTVWVNLAVYPKDAERIKEGQKATISAVGSEASTSGTVSYVTPVMDAQTRKITARIVIPNGNDIWRPGSFINACIEVNEGKTGLVVDRNAVLILDNKEVVFIQHEPGRFKPVPVTTGDKNAEKTMILAGLAEGQEYVNNGAFDLKAKIVTGSLGAHAGHGH